MAWEAVTAIATAFTGAVIAVTAIIALREVRVGAAQVRATRHQLEHLQKATQFEGALAVFAELDSDMQTEARHYVQFELGAKLEDDAYRDEVAFVNGADEMVHRELIVLRCFERIAFYERKALVDRETLLMVASGRIVIMWNCLERVVAILRASLGPGMWKNFENLYHVTIQNMAEQNVDALGALPRLREKLGLPAESTTGA